jgi:hypothetical protein
MSTPQAVACHRERSRRRLPDNHARHTSLFHAGLDDNAGIDSPIAAPATARLNREQGLDRLFLRHHPGGGADCLPVKQRADVSTIF